MSTDTFSARKTDIGDERTEVAAEGDVAAFRPQDGEPQARTVPDLLGDNLCGTFMVLKRFMVGDDTFLPGEFFDLSKRQLADGEPRYFIGRGIGLGEPVELDLATMEPIVVSQATL